MKIRVEIKAPNAFHEAVNDAVRGSSEPALEGDVSLKQAWDILSRWVSSYQFVTLEFDTESLTARVLACSEGRSE